jgi:succinylglutamate desuccinylase
MNDIETELTLNSTMLTIINALPEGLLDLEAHQLANVLEGPTLIHLEGRRDDTLFVSVLLHGNEPTGWESIRRLLKAYDAGGGEKPLPRNLSLFIGNISAAREGVRRLDGQPDYNRVWPGGEQTGNAEAAMMQLVVDSMVKRNLFASIDIHNNTGINPHYGCVNVIDNRFLRLALLFSRLVIYFLLPTGVQSLAMAKHCPAVTIEAGKVGDEAGIVHTMQFVDAALHLSELSAEPLHHEEVDLFHTVATVRIPRDVSFGFNAPDCTINFHEELERYNFRELPRETVWAEVAGQEIPVEVFSEDGERVTGKYFEIDQGLLRNSVAVMPSMLTMDHRVIEQDCLCYLMERWQHV